MSIIRIITLSKILFLHFDSLLLRYMSVEVLRESACDCIHEIISKGMEPVAKKKLVESLLIVLEQSGILIPHEVCRLFKLLFVIVVVSSAFALCLSIFTVRVCFVETCLLVTCQYFIGG